ncbi:S49 family peptidase [Devosia sp. FJ2-5-3]|uniref:S49 family peptidase n=1 Tax=Devosia sp. FJ2-5-3 TaxID=2976680 RepID=UPI0023D869BE|nr:S49 family peptidase [Devosia sp. FJ2-5-3]WEJ60230.1 S49 family peptidase [Devosia sp. FJ2-5-3]
MSIYDVALAEAWAMRADALESLLAIAGRTNEVTPEALEAYRTKFHEKGAGLRIRDDVAIIDFAGPMFKKANLFQAMSGATSYATMATDFQTALDDPKISGIIGLFDTPGGTVNGCDELAASIFAARGAKPMVAYVSGQMCSAGYWLGTAFGKVVMSDASIVGSIGVILGIEDRTVADERRGVKTVEFVSSKAPGKRPDYDTDEGKALIQRRVDELEAVFIAAVAKHRGIDEATVIKDFGAGGVEIGANAVKLKMADAVGSFESVFADLTQRGSRRTTKPTGARSMANDPGASGEEKTYTKAELDKAVADGIASYQTRQTAILGSDEGKANPKLAASLAAQLGLTAEAAIAILKDAGPAAVEKTDAQKAEDFKNQKKQGDGLAFAGEAGEQEVAFDWDDAFGRKK